MVTSDEIHHSSLTHSPSLFLVLIDIVVSVANALNLLSVFIGNLNAKFLFKTHHQFDRVQRVGTEVVNETLRSV